MSYSQWNVVKGNFAGYVVGPDQSDRGTIKTHEWCMHFHRDNDVSLCAQIKFHCEHKNRTPVNKVIMELKITLHSSTKFRNVVLWGVPIKVPKRLLEGFHSVLENWQVNNSPQKIHMLRCPKKYFESTHEIEECCSLISCSEGFKASARRFSLCAWNFKFWAKTKIRKIVHTQRCLRKYFAYTNETEECCSLISSSERSIASAQIFSLRDWKLVKTNKPRK